MSCEWNINHLVFIDESGFSTSMARRYGRSLLGQRLYDYVPDSRWKVISMISALRISGPTSSLMFKGSLTGELFVTWLKESLCPVLKKGDIVILDNLSCHKVAGVTELLSQVGARAEYLPPYSPDLNPIEKMWSKVKAILRGRKVRREEEIFREAGYALSKVTGKDAKSWFQSCNYCLSL